MTAFEQILETERLAKLDRARNFFSDPWAANFSAVVARREAEKNPSKEKKGREKQTTGVTKPAEEVRIVTVTIIPFPEKKTEAEVVLTPTEKKIPQSIPERKNTTGLVHGVVRSRKRRRY